MRPSFYSFLLTVATLGNLLAVPQDGLIALWDFESGSSNSATGEGALPDGSLQGGATITSATAPIMGNYLQLDGSDDFMDVGDSFFFDSLDNGWSAAAWFRADRVPTGSERFFVFETSGGFPISLGLRVGNTGSTNAQVFTELGTGSSFFVNTQIPNMEITDWNHILITYENIDNARTLTVYLNGVRSDSISLSGPLQNASDGFHVGTFRSPTTQNRWFPGSIDEVTLWDRALTPFEAGFFQEPIIVTTLTDEDDGDLNETNGDGTSLREAILHSPSRALIQFAPNVFGGQQNTISLTQGQLSIDDKELIIDASSIPSGVTINANQQSRVMLITPNSTVALHRLTLTGGVTTGSGGGIFSSGATLSLRNCTLSGNSVGADGGGIFNLNSTLNLSNCTLSGNSTGFRGGGIFSSSDFPNLTTTLTNCTLHGNRSEDVGGGFYNDFGLSRLRHCTITENSSPPNKGGGIASFGRTPETRTEIAACIVRDNIGDDVQFAESSPLITPTNSFTSIGGNIVGDGNATDAFTNSGDQVGTDTPILLAPLAHYGGPTQTRHPLAGSPAIFPSISTTLTDQRGFTLTGPSTIGSVKIGRVNEVTSEVTLRTALLDSAGQNGNVIRFGSILNGETLTLSFGSQLEVPSTANGLFIDASSLTDGLIIDANQQSRVMEIRPNATVALHGLTLTGGNTTGNFPRNSGGGIFSSNATLSLSDCTLSGNSAGFSGGGIYSQNSTLSLSNCTLSGNSAGARGGGIFSDTNLSNQTTSLTNCTLHGNSSGNFGGGFYNNDGLSRLTNCTITENSSVSSQGGGISSFGDDVTRTEVSACIARDNTGGDVQFVGNNANTNSFLSLGDNIVGDGNATGAFNSTNNDQVGTSTPILLAPLFDYGGPTQTRFPLPGSPAIDAATNSTRSRDQRGFSIVGIADVGAVELQGNTDFPLALLALWNTDTDGDGNPFGLEFVLGTDPNLSDANNPRNPRISAGPEGPALLFGRNPGLPDGITVTITRSPDLSSPFVQIGSFQSTNDVFDSPNGAFGFEMDDFFRYQDNTPTPRAFFRIDTVLATP